MRPQIIFTLLITCCAAQIQRAQHRHLGVRLDALHQRIQRRNNTPYEAPVAAGANMGSSVPSTTEQQAQTGTAGTAVDTETPATQPSDPAAVYDTVFVTSTRARQQQSTRRSESSNTQLNLVSNIVTPTTVSVGIGQTSASADNMASPSSTDTASHVAKVSSPHVIVVSTPLSTTNAASTPTLIGAPVTTTSLSDIANTIPTSSSPISTAISADSGDKRPPTSESGATPTNPTAFVNPFDLAFPTVPATTSQAASTPVTAQPNVTNLSGVSGLTSAATTFETPLPSLAGNPEATDALSGTISTANSVAAASPPASAQNGPQSNSPDISGLSPTTTTAPPSVAPAVLPTDPSMPSSSPSPANGPSSHVTALSGLSQGVADGSPQTSSVVTPSDPSSLTESVTTTNGVPATPTNHTTFRGPVTSDTTPSTPLPTAVAPLTTQLVNTQEPATTSSSSHGSQPTTGTTGPAELPTSVPPQNSPATTDSKTSSPSPAPVQTMELPSAVLTAPSTPASTSAAQGTTATTQQTASATNTPALPAAIAPAAGIIMPNSAETLVQIGFLEPLNYPFVVSNALSTAQILSYTPKCVAYALGLTNEAILANSLRPYDKSGYIATVAYIVIPSANLTHLEGLWSNSNSALYNQQDSSLQSLAVQIDPSIPLLVTGSKGSTVSAASGNTGDAAVQANSASYGSLADTGPSSSSTGSTKRVVSIGIGSAAAAGMYASLMFFVARRYRSRRITLFAPSLRSTGAGLRGTRGISRPMNPENSLGI